MSINHSPSSLAHQEVGHFEAQDTEPTRDEIGAIWPRQQLRGLGTRQHPVTYEAGS